MYPHDPRHVDVVVKDLGVEHRNSVQTPAKPDVTEEEESEPLSQDQHHRYRSQVTRCWFFSQNRADIIFIVNELCQKMSSPNQRSLAKLKRLVRCSQRERQWRQVFEYGKVAEELTVFTDSDWAGCKETRKSSSAGVTMLGRHTPWKHTHESRRSLQRAAQRQNRMQQHWERQKRRVQIMMWCDLGFAVKPVLAIDAKATEHIFSTGRELGS